MGKIDISLYLYYQKIEKVKRESRSSFEQNFFRDVFNVTIPVDVVRSASLDWNGVTSFVAEILLEQRSTEKAERC